MFHSLKEHLQIKFTFEFDHFDWLSQFYSEWRKTPKFVNFEGFCSGQSMWFKCKLEND